MAKQKRKAIIEGMDAELKVPESEIRDFIKSNVAFTNLVGKMKRVMRTHFALSQQEVETQILRICESKDEKMAIELFDMLQEFVKGEEEVVDQQSRHNFALSVISDALALFKSENEKVSAEFIDCLREAKRQGIDPFKFASKTNMRKASFDKFQETLKILAEKKYQALGNKTIVKGSELKEILEQCTTLAFELEEEEVEEILSFLSDFAYDEKTNSYFADVHKMIKLCPSLLMAGSENILNSLAMIENEFIRKRGMDKAEVVLRIAQSPSILLVSENVVSTVMENLKKEILDLLPDSKIYRGEELNKTATTLAENLVYNLDNFTQLSSKTASSGFSQMARTLKNYLGTDNAITCMQNLSVLKRDPDVVEYVLAVLSSSPDSDTLRSDFISSPTKYFEQYEKYAALAKEGSNERTRREKTTVEIQELPQIQVDGNKIEELSKKLNKSQRSEVSGLIKKAMEDLQRKREEEEAERLARAQAEATAKQKKKEEEKARKAESKRLAKEYKKAQRMGSTPIVMAKTEPVQEKTQGEKIIDALNRLISNYQHLKEDKNYSISYLINHVYGQFEDKIIKKFKIENNLFNVLPVERLSKLSSMIINFQGEKRESQVREIMSCAVLLNDVLELKSAGAAPMQDTTVRLPIDDSIYSILNEQWKFSNEQIKRNGLENDKFFRNAFTILDLLEEKIKGLAEEENALYDKIAENKDLLDKDDQYCGNTVKLIDNLRSGVMKALSRYHIESFGAILTTLDDNDSKEIEEKITDLVMTYFDKAAPELKRIKEIFKMNFAFNPSLNIKLLLQGYIVPYLVYIIKNSREQGLYNNSSDIYKYWLKVYGKKEEAIKKSDGETIVEELNSSNTLQVAKKLTDMIMRKAKCFSACDVFNSILEAIGKIDGCSHGLEVVDDELFIFSGQFNEENGNKAMAIGSLKIDNKGLMLPFRTLFGVNAIGLNHIDGIDEEILPASDDDEQGV